MPRRTTRQHPLHDPTFQRQVERLIAEQRSSLPTDAALDAAAVVTEADIVSAESLWDLAQRQAATGLDRLLSAKEERA